MKMEVDELMLVVLNGISIFYFVLNIFKTFLKMQIKTGKKHTLALILFLHFHYMYVCDCAHACVRPLER